MTRIFNRDDFQHPSDGWYQIEAKGDHPNRAAGVVQIIDDEAIKSIVNRFNADAAAGTLSHGHEMLVDIEHFKDQADKESRAYGWLRELQAREDGIYGRILWTTTGKPAVDGGDYRFFSTEYSLDDSQVFKNGKTKEVRPLRLDGLTLTNMNNNKGQKPITNRVGAAQDTNEPHRSEVEPGYPKPALEAWFKAVESMKRGVKSNAGAQPEFWQAWNLCKRQHPELYEAAFGSLAADPFGDPANDYLTDKSAAEMASNIANRIKSESGCTFGEAWSRTQMEAPKLFNRGHGLKRENAQESKQRRENDEVRMDAANFLRQLAEQEKNAHGLRFEQAWNRVCNRERTLEALMNARLTPEQVFSVRPDLFRRLYVDHA
ncbi:MAG TPA: phage protease [Verrucomicrobiae bacterium]|nr:phage protease [Verrucomicrobiae bacterium]